jgi:phosphoesterase RecJ-like protein
MPIDWPRFVEAVSPHNSFVLTSHLRPDCDALGSELAMAEILELLGKSVRIINPMATPDMLAFIDPSAKVLTLGQGVSVEEAADTDALMVLDTSAWDQLGPMGEVIRATRATKIVLDHHVSGDELGAEVFRDAQSPATGCLVVEAADALGVELTEPMATPLFAAIVTDTGWLRFSATTSGTYRTTARLVDAGADPTAIYQILYEQDTLPCIQLRGRALERANTDLDGRLIYSSVRRADFADTCASPSDTEGLINMTLAVAGVEAAILFCEQLEADAVKVSFRSRGGLDCSELASSLGGGGHKQASGVYIEGDFDTIAARVLDATRSAMR